MSEGKARSDSAKQSKQTPFQFPFEGVRGRVILKTAKNPPHPPYSQKRNKIYKPLKTFQEWRPTDQQTNRNKKTIENKNITIYISIYYIYYLFICYCWSLLVSSLFCWSLLVCWSVKFKPTTNQQDGDEKNDFPVYFFSYKIVYLFNS